MSALALRGPAGVFAVVLLEFALGSLAAVVVAPFWGVVKRGFFLLTAASVATTAACAWLAARHHAPLSLRLFAGASVAILALVAAKQMTAARIVGVATTGVGVCACVELAQVGAGSTTPGVIAMLTGAAFLGVTWEGMLLGHWYLVDRKLTASPMRWMAVAYEVGVVLALVSSGLARSSGTAEGSASLNPLLLVSHLTLYLAFGLVATCALLAFFVHKLVWEGSIRAATGMLYLAVILAFSAEFAAKARFFS